MAVPNARSLVAALTVSLTAAATAANACGGDDAVATSSDAAVVAPFDAPVEAARPDATPDAGCVPDPGPGDAGLEPTPDDAGNPIPDAATFTLAHALAGYPAVEGTLTAHIDTDLGRVTCTLDEKAAPITVANFVGLARGTRPYLGDGGFHTGRFYDGLIFHRVIPDFVIQGGDPRGNGTGGPGYSIPNENHAPQDTGVLAMAASQDPDSGEPTPSGSQFYVVVGTGPKPDYNVFGRCNLDVAKAISQVERRANDKPRVAVPMRRVSIERCPRR